VYFVIPLPMTTGGPPVAHRLDFPAQARRNPGYSTWRLKLGAGAFLALYRLIVNDVESSTAPSEENDSMQTREPTMNESRHSDSPATGASDNGK